MISNKEDMNKIIKHMAKNQNDKNKLNAGQLREAVHLYEKASVELFGSTTTVTNDYYREHILKGEKKVRTKRV